MGLLSWTEKSPTTLANGGVIGPDERLPWPQTGVMGVQHLIAMFGATVLAPILMGFDPNVAILMSGIGTLIFFLITGGKVPSYLGSSFAFIGVVIAATGYAGSGPNANIGVALGGIIACGLLYTLIGVVVQAIGTGWIEALHAPGGHRRGGGRDRPEPGRHPDQEHGARPTSTSGCRASPSSASRWWPCSAAAWCSAC